MLETNSRLNTVWGHILLARPGSKVVVMIFQSVSRSQRQQSFEIPHNGGEMFVGRVSSIFDEDDGSVPGFVDHN